MPVPHDGKIRRNLQATVIETALSLRLSRDTHKVLGQPGSSSSEVNQKARIAAWFPMSARVSTTSLAVNRRGVDRQNVVHTGNKTGNI
jgi:hypothetical protein